jgi:glycosyltransferase involved in cell wall biosynthesis
MKIAMITPGMLAIPPKGWGAVELVVWQRKLHLEQRGHVVDLFNTTAIHKILEHVNEHPYDFVHCHTELFAGSLNRHLRSPYALTSHYGGWYRFVPGGPDYRSFDYLFRDTFDAPAHFVLSERIRDKYLRHGYAGFLTVLPNSVETDRFHFESRATRGAICIGRIKKRKRQAWLAKATEGVLPIDFVGPWSRELEADFQENATARYLGAWDRTTLYQRLTEYACLVALSDSEAAAPLVVLEALAAGLSVVVNEACADNLAAHEFVTVLPDDETRPEVITQAIAAAIDRNPRVRATARAYACDHLDYSIGTEAYLTAIDRFREAFPAKI